VFAEALSRNHFRKAISSEVFFGADRSERYTNGAYSATNSQETAAKFAEVLFDDGLGRVYSQKKSKISTNTTKTLYGQQTNTSSFRPISETNCQSRLNGTGKTSSKTSIGDTENCDPPNHIFR